MCVCFRREIAIQYQWAWFPTPRVLLFAMIVIELIYLKYCSATPELVEIELTLRLTSIILQFMSWARMGPSLYIHSSDATGASSTYADAFISENCNTLSLGLSPVCMHSLNYVGDTLTGNAPISDCDCDCFDEMKSYLSSTGRSWAPLQACSAATECGVTVCY